MIAEPQFKPDRYELAVAAIHALIAERGIGRHALFHEVGEGRAYPDGSEEMSGYVIDENGQTYTFWTGWDTENRRAVFTTWEPVELDSRDLSSREYLEARAEAGLPTVSPAPTRQTGSSSGGTAPQR